MGDKSEGGGRQGGSTTVNRGQRCLKGPNTYPAGEVLFNVASSSLMPRCHLARGGYKGSCSTWMAAFSMSARSTVVESDRGAAPGGRPGETPVRPSGEQPLACPLFPPPPSLTVDILK